ncbi:hypothetical protein B4147_2740 [Bacillus wiedmannii]|uniref:Uncharacterized protein n=1 Tax=Bacillus wiedmannii TaxID=1890302 RepID=A0A0G8C2A4_9BACI|nr:hypothetical protein B4147_2740 [Bacillus wiedmannii]
MSFIVSIQRNVNEWYEKTIVYTLSFRITFMLFLNKGNGNK